MVGSSNPSIWGTWEDLLLAYAVRRHGVDCWDSVAAELRHRSSYGHLLNARCCYLRFNQLNRRFSTGNPFADTLKARSDVPWLEDLRRLRVAELRRDVQRYDASIMSLQKKVKTLTEACETPASAAGDPDRISYRSSKESNTADPDQEARRVPDPAADGSCHGSTATEAKETGDAQSSASLTKRWSWRRRKETLPEKEQEGGGPTSGETTKIESQPLMSFLEMITSDKLCSVFMRKLESQMSKRYEELIRRHMDLETVREKLLRDQQGDYIDIHLYRDLLLICNNAIVFYPKGSREYIAALHLRHLSTPRHHTAMPTLLACGSQRGTAPEPVKVKVKVKVKKKNKKEKKEKLARKTRAKKRRRRSSSITLKKKKKKKKKKNIRTSSPPVEESEVEKKSGRQLVQQAKCAAPAIRQHIQPVKKRVASSAPASTPPQKRARKVPESKRTSAKPPPPAAAKKPRPRRR